MHGYMYTCAYATFGIYIAILTAFGRINILVAKATRVIFNIILYIVFFFYCNLHVLHVLRKEVSTWHVARK